MSLLRNAILGGWRLSSFHSRDTATGEVRQPLGAHPRGLILYTDDGWMSAQLAPDPAGAELGHYIAYGGRFHLDEDTAVVHHRVVMSTIPELLESPQLRDVRIEGDRLVLAADGVSGGATTRSTLVWRRDPTREG